MEHLQVVQLICAINHQDLERTHPNHSLDLLLQVLDSQVLLLALDIVETHCVTIAHHPIPPFSVRERGYLK